MPEPKPPPPEDEERDLTPAPQTSPVPRVPAPREVDADTTKRYMKAVERLAGAALTVRTEGGSVKQNHAPARLAGALTERIQNALTDFGGGGSVPMFLGALGGASMTFFFGDPFPDEDEAQEQMPVPAIASYASRIAGLIDLDGPELRDEAIRIGRPARRYTELARFVESEGFTLHWQPLGEPTRTLTPGRAAVQARLLERDPPTDDRTLTVNGRLYRVITDRSDDRLLGSLGIHLFPWSNRPPARGGQARGTVIAPYSDLEVEKTIKDQRLIGEAVEAEVLIRAPRPGLSIDPQKVHLEITAIADGPDEDSRQGETLFDE